MNLLNTLRHAFARNSVDNIVASVEIQIARLKKAADAHRAHADTQYARIDKLHSKAEAATHEALRADRIASRYAKFVA
jgi:hypothetical protein